MDKAGGSGEAPPEPEPAAAATVKSIVVYPIKSCRGISVPQAAITFLEIWEFSSIYLMDELGWAGLRWDRQWLVMNSAGRAFTQRVEPKLALIEVEMPQEAFTEEWQPTPDSHMVIRAPGLDPLKIPLGAKRATVDDVSVWEWSGSAYDEGDEAAEWFSSYFGKPTRLVRFNEASEIRETNPDYAQGYKVLFADAFPFLLASQGSVDALNSILKEPVPMNRFRPNIIVDGCQPYSEDLWKTIKIDKLTFLGVKLCDRCKVPTINQDNGIPGEEPTEALQALRSDEVLRPSHKNKRRVYFGQNLVCKESLSEKDEGRIIKVGDPVYVLESFPSSDEVPA
uniref:MOSC domain-containing protein n=2 Tax=Oryza TaxID=4527 RepID=A0A0D3HA15_9ORYZ